MFLVGLTGGLASGKTFVGEVLVTLGCHLIQADELGHRVLLPEGEAFDAVVKEFGRGILDQNGAIDRRKLGMEVFERPDRLAALSKLVHPPVIRREEAMLREFEASDPNGIAVVEAAILIETGSYRRFDRLIVTICSEEQQIARAIDRNGWTREEAVMRLRRQMPLSEKIKFAHYVIDTSGNQESTVEQTRAVYQSLRSLQK